MTLVKNILRSSISSIAYLRYLFPEENFSDTKLAGLKLKALIPDANPEAFAINEWIEKGVFDAIEKHYLKSLVFSIFAEFNNPASLLESYTFTFTYPKNGNISMGLVANAKGQQPKEYTYMTREQIQHAWCQIVRTLITLSHTLPPLPTERHIGMRIYYYDDVTPEDYNPPGFVNADTVPAFQFVTDSECINIGGALKTKFHSLNLKLDTAVPNYSSSQQHQQRRVSPSDSEVDEKTELAMLSIMELKNDEFEINDLIEKVGVEENQLNEILKKLIEMKFVEIVAKDKFKRILNIENQDRIDSIISKYNTLDTENDIEED